MYLPDENKPTTLFTNCKINIIKVRKPFRGTPQLNHPHAKEIQREFLSFTKCIAQIAKHTIGIIKRQLLN